MQKMWIHTPVFMRTVGFSSFLNPTIFCPEHSVFDIKIGETTVHRVMPICAFKLVYKCQEWSSSM